MVGNTFKAKGYNINFREYYFQASANLSLAMLEKEFPQFLLPHPMVQTSGRTPNQPLLGVIAKWQGQATGLVVVEKRDDQSGLIICWHVNKAHQGFGLGRKLLRQIERFAIANGLQILSLSFRGDTSFRPQITKILHRLDWQMPKKELMLYKFSPKQFLQMPWCQNMSLPPKFEIFAWNTLTNADKQHILDRQEQGNWYPVELSPLFDAADFEPTNSVGLRWYGTVVGWLITHKVHADVIEYSRLFVSPELQGLGRGIHLIIEAIKRQHEHGLTRGIFQVQTANTKMISFVERRMAESITAQTGRWVSRKLLSK